MNDRSWLHPALAPAPSPIAGLGLFTAEQIAAGEVCVRMGGRIIDDDEMRTLEASGAPYSAFRLDAHRHVVQSDDDPARFGNHSCDPNLVLADATTLVARRDIAAGEEITSDYATMTDNPSWRMTCNCGAADCRRVVTG